MFDAAQYHTEVIYNARIPPGMWLCKEVGFIGLTTYGNPNESKSQSLLIS